MPIRAGKDALTILGDVSPGVYRGTVRGEGGHDARSRCLPMVPGTHPAFKTGPPR